MSDRESSTVVAITLLLQQLSYEAALAVARNACRHADQICPPPVPSELQAFRAWVSEDGIRGPGFWPGIDD